MKLKLVEKADWVMDRNQNSSFSDLYDMAKALLSQKGSEDLDLAECIWEKLPATADLEVVIQLYNTLLSELPSNGKAVITTVERWLEEKSDQQKILVALNLDFFPFASKIKMIEVLQSIAEKYPELELICQRVISER